MRRLTSVGLIVVVLAGCTVDEVPEPGLPAPKAPTPATGAEEAPVLPTGERTGPPPLISARTARQESVDALLAKGVRVVDSDDLPAADRIFTQALAAAPTNRKALFLSAKTSQDIAAKLARPQNSPWYLKAAAAARTLRTTFPALSDEEKPLVAVILYNEACTLAQNGELARVVPVLTEAYAAGFDELAQIDLDPELDPVRKTPEFRALLERMEREHVAKLVARFKPFPFEFTLPDTDDKPVSLAGFKGKVVVVDFWGTWCPPCRKELPHLAALYRKHHDQGLEIVGLNYENAEGAVARDFVKKFARENDIPYPCLMGDRNTQNLVPDFEGYPTTLFLDREGKVRLKVTGYQPLGALEAAVAPLLGAVGP